MLPTTEIKHAAGWEDRYNPKTGKMEATYVGFQDDFDKDSDDDIDFRKFDRQILSKNPELLAEARKYFMNSLKKKEKLIRKKAFMEDPRWDELSEKQKKYIYHEYREQYNYYQENGYDF